MAKVTSYGICPYRLKDGIVQLLVGRPKGHTDYGFIKGKSKKSEKSAIDTARREFWEETNGAKVKKSKMTKMFFQINKAKNVGIFIVHEADVSNSYQFLNINGVWEHKENRELQEVLFMDIDKININKNQSKILQNIKDDLSSLSVS